MMSRIFAKLGRLGGAAALAGAALLGTTTGTTGDPATACGAPKQPFDRAGYEKCIRAVEEVWAEGFITNKELRALDEKCCTDNGGLWVDDLEDPDSSYCEDPADSDFEDEGPPLPGRLPQIPGPTEATQVPPPPSGPVVQLPGMPPAQTG